MIPYFLLIVLAALGSLIAIKHDGRDRTICIGTSQSIKIQNIALPMFFQLLFLLLALRDETVGRDLLAYKGFFGVYAKMRFSSYLKFEPEILFGMLNWAVGQITSEYQWFLVSVAALTVAPVAVIYSEDRRHSLLKILLFVNMGTFVMFFSGIRQTLAMAVGMVAYLFVRKKQLLPFLLMVLLAMGIHHSGFMLLAMYPLYHVRLKRKYLLFVVPGVLVIFVFNRQIFTFLTGLLAEYSDEYDAALLDSTGAYGTLFLFVVFTVFSYIVPDEREMDKETLGLRNFLLLSVVLQSFAPLHTLAMRMNYYYILFIPMLLPKVVEIPRPEYRQVARVAEIVLCLFFAVMFFRTIYTGYVTGVSALDTVPYIPFWK